MKQENALKICQTINLNKERSKEILKAIYNKIFDEAMRGKGAIEMTWQYSEPAEADVLHQLKEDGYDVQYISLEPIVVRISWI